MYAEVHGPTLVVCAALRERYARSSFPSTDGRQLHPEALAVVIATPTSNKTQILAVKEEEPPSKLIRDGRPRKAPTTTRRVHHLGTRRASSVSVTAPALAIRRVARHVSPRAGQRDVCQARNRPATALGGPNAALTVLTTRSGRTPTRSTKTASM